jgi:hypothetical protein
VEWSGVEVYVNTGTLCVVSAMRGDKKGERERERERERDKRKAIKEIMEGNKEGFIKGQPNEHRP